MEKLKFYTQAEVRIYKESERIVLLLPNGENVVIRLDGNNELNVRASERVKLTLYTGASFGIFIGDNINVR